jgi:uncharacterized protein (UPF0264 family)
MTAGAIVHLPAGLLVSVRSTDEATAAVAGGAAIVDVKEPANGPLGPATPDVAAAIGDVVRGRVPWTLACGELSGGAGRLVAHVQRVLDAVGPAAASPAAAKAGPAGMGLAEWQREYGRLVAGLPAGVEAVAVAYADWRQAAAPEPAAIFAAGAAAGAATVLVDTFDKSGPGLVHLVGLAGIRSWHALATTLGLRLALAGRLGAGDVAAIAPVGPVVIGVRSAACGGVRDGRVGTGHVVDLVGRLSRSRGRSDGILTGV